MLETPRLRLRKLEDRDRDALVAALSDWEVAQWLIAPPYPFSEAHAESWIARVRADHERGRPVVFGVAMKDSDELIGIISCGEPGGEPHEVGYWFARPHWGRGYAGEALAALLVHARGELGAGKLVAYTDPANAASRAVLRRAGFVEVGTGRREKPTKRGAFGLVEFALDAR